MKLKDYNSISKKKKKAKTSSIVLTAVCILVVGIALAITYVVNTQPQQESVAAEEVKIYFFDPTTQALKAESRPMAAEGAVDAVKYVLEELAMGPKNSSLQPSVAKDLIQSATISGDNVEVAVAESYQELSAVEEMTARTAIASTLTGLPAIHSITISIGGQELAKTNGQAFGKIHAADIVTQLDVNPAGESTQAIVLYFSSADGTELVAETRTVSINPNESIAKYIVTEIISGPTADGLRATVPPDAKLLDVRTSEGMCSLDFSKEFISKHTDDYPPEIITIYSIVNSLCEQSDIKSVQFMIEGERQDHFNDFPDFKSLFEAKEITPEDVHQ